MRVFAIALLLLVTASSAFAGTIIDIQMGGVYAENDIVTVNGAVVTGVRYNGFFMSEIPNAAYAGIWVYTGADPGVLIGDEVNVVGEYVEYNGLSEIMANDELTSSVVIVGEHAETLVSIQLTLAELNADPELYEGCFITITDGLIVTDVGLGHGEWLAESVESPGEFLVFDDYWYNFDDVVLGECYNCVTGVLNYNYGAFKLEPYSNSICHTDCTVSNESESFGGLKSLYR